jgi:Na+/H+ antiporter NhaA
MTPLGLTHRYAQSDVELANYASWFFDSPVYWHGFYAAISLALAALFLWRRQPADIVMAALQLSGVGFAASFFIISIACDYRYLYFTDLAALAGLLYAAIDPPAPWRNRRNSTTT